MSLKHFHLVFIACSEGLMAFLENWSRAQRSAGSPDCGAGWIAPLGIAAGLVYLAWFVRRYRTLQ
ncbi:MAG: hypothetical protein HY077_00795 [Elusimicrobia bacterium]|nr:hypothetical protein [Elusimicrobiota bacterium]